MTTKFELMGNNGFTTEDYPQPEIWAEVLADMGVRRMEYFADHLEPILFQRVFQEKSEFFRATTKALEDFDLEVFSGATARVSYLLNMLSHPYPDMRAEAVKWVERFIDLSASLGGEYISGHYDCISRPDAGHNLEEYEFRMADYLSEISHYAKEKGMKGIFLEQMHRRQLLPFTIEGAERVLKRANQGAAVPILMHVDLGHAAHVTGEESHGERDRDPMEWLANPWGKNKILLVHTQQTDNQASRHWPFTEEYNSKGIIDGRESIRAVEKSGVERCVLALEVLFPRGTPIDLIRQQLTESTRYWRDCFKQEGYKEAKKGEFEKD